jgi:hypothetical protein
MRRMGCGPSAATSKRINEQLERVDDKVELNVKAAHDEDAVVREILLGDPTLRRRNEALRAVEAAATRSGSTSASPWLPLSRSAAPETPPKSSTCCDRMRPKRCLVHRLTATSSTPPSSSRPGTSAVRRVGGALATGTRGRRRCARSRPTAAVQLRRRRLQPRAGVMSVLSQLLLAPLAPARLALWSIDRLVDSAERKLYDPAVIRRELASLVRQLDDGLIDAAEFDLREDELLDRLTEGRQR